MLTKETHPINTQTKIKIYFYLFGDKTFLTMYCFLYSSRFRPTHTDIEIARGKGLLVYDFNQTFL
jgi:hypothetical protein